MPLTTSNTMKSRPRGLRHLSGLLAAIALLAGLLVPVSAARAELTYGKPTSVSAVKISGSNGIKVTWKAPSGTPAPAAYKVSWGTSSKATSASFNTYVTGTSATLSSASMLTKTAYYVWVTPWSEAKSSGTATGAISSADKVTTSGYAYKAPLEIHAVNPTKTSMEITWRTVTGSPGYVLRAYNYTTGKYSYQIGYDGSAIFTGLTPNTKYKFTVANRLLISGYDTVPGVRVSGWSSASSTKSTNPTTVTLPDATTSPMRDVPTDLAMTDRDSSSVSLSWTPPAGYDPATDKFRVYWAEDQEMTDNDGYTKTSLTGTSGKVTGLESNTNYYVRIRMVRETIVNGVTVVTAISDRTQAIMVKTRSPKGFLTGAITGLGSSDLNDYVATAYGRSSTGVPNDVKGTANVSGSGTFKLELRPGTYLIQLAYVGTGNFTTVWLTNDGSTAYSSADADAETVTLDATTAAGTVPVGTGATITGTVTSSATGNPIRDVNVSARLSSNKEVVGQASTNSTGTYTLKGLPPSTSVIVRFNSSTGVHRTKDLSALTTPAANGSRDLDTTMVPA
ncbi:hypothetical protein PROP_00416 [Propionicimonas sp. T2.31MG-18]|uniref:fibronectin type III domain-containing protein n=1 Tax=Propionicimonas sp. T2.31MG-18 TaxID=3157620 RepID=UPI0035EED0E5